MRGPLIDRAADDEALRMAHEQLRTWKDCAKVRCRRARTCLGDLKACGEEFGEPWTWLQHALGAVRAGKSPRAAMLAADFEFRPKMQKITFQWSGGGKPWSMKIPLDPKHRPSRR
jgi:hypothetical protein